MNTEGPDRESDVIYGRYRIAPTRAAWSKAEVLVQNTPDIRMKFLLRLMLETPPEHK